jgi:hypothetical protein
LKGRGNENGKTESEGKGKGKGKEPVKGAAEIHFAEAERP